MESIIKKVGLRGFSFVIYLELRGMQGTPPYIVAFLMQGVDGP